MFIVSVDYWQPNLTLRTETHEIMRAILFETQAEFHVRMIHVYSIHKTAHAVNSDRNLNSILMGLLRTIAQNSKATSLINIPRRLILQ
jgi:hypothetical protein